MFLNLMDLDMSGKSSEDEFRKALMAMDIVTKESEMQHFMKAIIKAITRIRAEYKGW